MRRFATPLALAALFWAGCGSPESNFKKGQDLFAKARYADAASAYERAAKGKEQSFTSQAWLGLARSRQKLERLPEGLEAAQKALETAKTEPDKVEASLGLAELLALNGKPDEADAILRSLEGKGEGSPHRSDAMIAIARARGAAPLVQASEYLGMDAIQMAVGKVEVIGKIDRTKFPYPHKYVEKGGDQKILSPDGKRFLWRGPDKDGYFLYVSDADGKNVQKIKECKNAFQPAWAPDSKRILYSAMNYSTKKRSLMIYELATSKVKKAFESRKGVGSMAAFSLDGSKIAFTYYGELWMMNANGIGRTNVNLKEQIKQPVKEAELLAWGRDGSQLVYRPLGIDKTFLINFTHKEIPRGGKSQ